MRFSRSRPCSRSATGLVAAGLTVAVALLAGCGNGAEPAPSTSPSAPASAKASASATPSPSASKVAASNNLDKLDVTGGYGKEPKVAFKAPWAIDKTRTTVLEANDDGAEVKAGQSVTVDYYGVNGRTGKKFDDSFSRGAPATFPLDQVVPGFAKGLVGQKQGSRVLVAMPGSDGYDASGGSPQAGINVGDTLVFVIDLVDVQLTGPDGTKVDPKAGLPTVTDAKGVPSVTVPKTDPPKALVVQPLIKGKGAEVVVGDTITFNYRWYTWKGGLLEDSYTAGQPGSVPVASLFQGLQKGLVGQTVGSRVLLVVPPSLSYPNGNATPKVDKTDTQVLVVDLLFTQAQQ